MNIAALKVASPMVANLAAEENTGKRQVDQPVHLMLTMMEQHMGPNALAVAGKAETAHWLVKLQEVRRVHMDFAAVEQQRTNRSSWPRQGWGSIALSLSQVETFESAKEALRRSSLEQEVLPVLEQQQQQLRLGEHHTGACHCWEVEAEACYSQAKEQVSGSPQVVGVETSRLAGHTEIYSPPLVAPQSSPREGAAQGSTVAGKSMARSQHSPLGVLQVWGGLRPGPQL